MERTVPPHKYESIRQTIDRLRRLVQQASVACEMLSDVNGEVQELVGIDVDAVDNLLSEVLEELPTD